MNVIDIKEGQVIDLWYCFGNDVGKNRVVKVSDDYTGMNRNIGYFAFKDRGPVMPKQQFVSDMKNNIYRDGVFAVWQYELDYSEKLKQTYEISNEGMGNYQH